MLVAKGFEIELLVTSEVRGRLFPIDATGRKCSLAEVKSDAAGDTCLCMGGASRRAAALAPASGPDVVSIDTGDYFFGAGVSFSVFGPNASAGIFGITNYEASGVGHLDLSAGAAVFRTFVELAQQESPDLVRPTVANLELEEDLDLGPRGTVGHAASSSPYQPAPTSRPLYVSL